MAEIPRVEPEELSYLAQHAAAELLFGDKRAARAIAGLIDFHNQTIRARRLGDAIKAATR